jgi:hypothetical protein
MIIAPSNHFPKAMMIRTHRLRSILLDRPKKSQITNDKIAENKYNKDKTSKPCTAFVPSKRVIVVEHFVIIEKHHPATNWIPLIDWEKQKECDDDENCCCEDDGDLGHEKIYFEQERFFVFSLLQIILTRIMIKDFSQVHIFCSYFLRYFSITFTTSPIRS